MEFDELDFAGAICERPSVLMSILSHIKIFVKKNCGKLFEVSRAKQYAVAEQVQGHRSASLADSDAPEDAHIRMATAYPRNCFVIPRRVRHANMRRRKEYIGAKRTRNKPRDHAPLGANYFPLKELMDGA